jgi:hypothetical protein
MGVVTFDLMPDSDGTPGPAARRTGRRARDSPGTVPATLPAYLRAGGLLPRRSPPAGSLDVLGSAVREDLGGLDSIETALALAAGRREPSADRADITRALRHARSLRDDLAGGAP